MQSHVHRRWLNSLRPSNAYMRHQLRPLLARIMAWRLFVAKPLSEPMLYYCQFYHKEQTSVKLYRKFKHFHFRRCIWKCRLEKVGHFVSVSIKHEQYRNTAAKVAMSQTSFAFRLFNDIKNALGIMHAVMLFRFLDSHDILMRYDEKYYISVHFAPKYRLSITVHDIKFIHRFGKTTNLRQVNQTLYQSNVTIGMLDIFMNLDSKITRWIYTLLCKNLGKNIYKSDTFLLSFTVSADVLYSKQNNIW